MDPDAPTPPDGIPDRLIALPPAVSKAERLRLDRHHESVERWKGESTGPMSRGNRVRLVVGVGCAALIAVCLYVPALILNASGLVVAWQWVWLPSLGLDPTWLTTQIVIVVAATTIAVMAVSRDPES